MKRKLRFILRFSLITIISLIGFAHTLFAFDKSGIVENLSTHFSKEISTVLISMLPIFELRGGIPVSVQVFHLPVFKAVILSVLGNMIPVIFLLLFWEWLAGILSRNTILKRWIDKLQGASLKRGKIVEEYKEMGLMLFVAIPLPVTGGWTGSLIAVLLGLSFWKSLLYIFLGVCVASLIVASLTLLGKVGAIIASVILLFLVIISIIKVIIDKNKKKEEI